MSHDFSSIAFASVLLPMVPACRDEKVPLEDVRQVYEGGPAQSSLWFKGNDCLIFAVHNRELV